MLFVVTTATAQPQPQFTTVNNRPEWMLNDKTSITTPAQEVWSVATAWQNDWASEWVHINSTEKKQSGEWIILSSNVSIKGGDMFVRDTDRHLSNASYWRGALDATCEDKECP